jgi:hypothetical protein
MWLHALALSSNDLTYGFRRLPGVPTPSLALSILRADIMKAAIEPYEHES